VSSIADRIRGIVGASRPAPDLSFPAPAPAASGSAVADLLGGECRDGSIVVERRWDAERAHGGEPIGVLAERLRAAWTSARALNGGAARAPFVFFDLETTGLSGGAGTYVFLVGCARFDGDEFVTRQYLLTRLDRERDWLQRVGAEIAEAGALVSFNGKSFDAPVLETRYLFHRLDWAGGELPHLDALHPARQFWRPQAREPDVGPWRSFPSIDRSSCSLASLERQLFGHHRTGDVAGFEIPGRYFQFIRTANAQPLVAVLEHNRLDLLSLAALTVRLLHLVRMGPAAAADAREALALGRVYWRAGDQARAEEAFRHAAASTGDVRLDADRWLALVLRRLRRFDEAADCWRRVLDAPGCPDRVAREATEALAIHHEHRVRDLTTARVFALRTLERVKDEGRAKWTEAVRHRLARIERKLQPALIESPLFLSCSLPVLPPPPSCGSPPSGRRTSS
jgi:uncharacterized protein